LSLHFKVDDDNILCAIVFTISWAGLILSCYSLNVIAPFLPPCQKFVLVAWSAVNLVNVQGRRFWGGGDGWDISARLWAEGEVVPKIPQIFGDYEGF